VALKSRSQIITNAPSEAYHIIHNMAIRFSAYEIKMSFGEIGTKVYMDFPLLKTVGDSMVQALNKRIVKDPATKDHVLKVPEFIGSKDPIY